jgi:inorganic pyrophosphatase
MDYTSLPLGARAPEIVNAIIEVPGRQANKYEYDRSLGVFRLDRPLYASVHYPGDYGFLPSTLGRDGDPLDVLVILPEPTFSGCLLEVRPVGVLQMLDQGVPDEKVLATAVSSPTHEGIREQTDLPSHVLKEIEHFFAVYKQLEGKHTEVRGWQGARAAQQLIRATHASFNRRLESGGGRG